MELHRNSMCKHNQLKQFVYVDPFTHCLRKSIKKAVTNFVTAFLWTSQGLNLGPPDYESVALTN